MGVTTRLDCGCEVDEATKRRRWCGPCQEARGVVVDPQPGVVPHGACPACLARALDRTETVHTHQSVESWNMKQDGALLPHRLAKRVVMSASSEDVGLRCRECGWFGKLEDVLVVGLVKPAEGSAGE